MILKTLHAVCVRVEAFLMLPICYPLSFCFVISGEFAFVGGFFVWAVDYLPTKANTLKTQRNGFAVVVFC